MRHTRVLLISLVVLSLSVGADGSPCYSSVTVRTGWPASGYNLADVEITCFMPRYSQTHYHLEITLLGSGVGRWKCRTGRGIVVQGEFDVDASAFVSLHNEFYRQGFFEMHDSVTSKSAQVDDEGVATVYLTQVTGTPDRLCFAVAGSTRCVQWQRAHDPPPELVHLREAVLEMAEGMFPRGDRGRPSNRRLQLPPRAAPPVAACVLR